MGDDSGGSIPRFCAEKFDEISRALGQIASMSEDLRALRKAVIGNGRVNGSLWFRVARLEEARSDNSSLRKRWGERLWRLMVASALVLCGWWLKSN